MEVNLDVRPEYSYSPDTYDRLSDYIFETGGSKKDD